MSDGFDVINLDNLQNNPYCKHGPTVLFKNEKKSFYSCSACRDRKLCDFYYEFNENKLPSEDKLKTWKDRYLSVNKPEVEFKKIRNKVFKLSAEKRIYCQSCNQFVFDDKQSHLNHATLSPISDEMMLEPIKKILKPVEINSSNAQFVFDTSTTNFVLSYLKKHDYDSILCIGAPSIFETLDPKLNKFLLDIDDRFMYFYDETKFQKYNMFNNHYFFNTTQNFDNFLTISKNLLLIIDPPYGGLIKLISNTISSIEKTFKGSKFDVFLIYPYFMDTWIKKWLNFDMLDYKVSYENHKKFSQNTKKGSPARIFTNLDLSKIELPQIEGYKFCEECKKYTFEENIHCYKCNTCPSRDGFYYKHCDICKLCVKTSYEHCKKCGFCHLDKECKSNKSCDLKRKKELLMNNNNKVLKIKK